MKFPRLSTLKDAPSLTQNKYCIISSYIRAQMNRGFFEAWLESLRLRAELMG